VEPKAFLKTAELLKDKREEEHVRTSIGRSYYAAFLYFRDYLKKLGLEKTIQPNKEVHAFVIQCLSCSENKTASKVSEYLNDLQQRREDADYHLDKELTSSEATSAFDQAGTTISFYHNNMTDEQEKELIKQASYFARLKG